CGRRRNDFGQLRFVKINRPPIIEGLRERYIESQLYRPRWREHLVGDERNRESLLRHVEINPSVDWRVRVEHRRRILRQQIFRRTEKRYLDHSLILIANMIRVLR